MKSDTIAAIATALSDAGIGIIRISGPEAIAVANRVVVNKKKEHTLKNWQTHTIHYGFVEENGTILDEVMAVSYTHLPALLQLNSCKVNRENQVNVAVLLIADKAGSLWINQINRDLFIVNDSQRINQKSRVETDHQILSALFDIDLLVHAADGRVEDVYKRQVLRLRLHPG